MQWLSIVSLLSLMFWGAYAQQSNVLGRWNAYLSLKNGVDGVLRGNEVYMATTSGLVFFRLDNWEVKAYTKIEGLSDINATCMAYDPQTHYVFIGYASGIIDFFHTLPEIRSIRDIYLNRNYTNKTIHQMKFYGGYMYICTDFGVVVYDLQKAETRYTYTKIANNPSDAPVYCIEFWKDTVYVGTSNGLYAADIHHPNLSDPAAWQLVPNAPVGKIIGIEVTQSDTGNQRLYVAMPNAIFYREHYAFYSLDSAKFAIKQINRIKGDRNRLFVATQFNTMGDTLGNVFLYLNDTLHSQRYGYRVKSLFGTEDLYFLIQIEEFDGLLLSTEWGLWPVVPETPPNNFCNQIAVGPNELYVAPKGYGDAKVPSYNESGVYYFDLIARKWKILNRYNGGLDTLRANRDIATAYYDYATQTAYLGSWGQGFCTLQHGQLQNAYFNDNTGLVGTTLTSNGYVDIRVSGVAKDKNGNLWFTTYLASKPVAVWTTNGNWYTFPQTLLGNNTKVSDILVDDFNQKWILVDGQGLYVLDDRNTPDNPNDDRSRYLGTGFGQGNLSSTYVYCMAKDLNGNIWVGTNKGVNVFYNPGNIFDYSNLSDAVCPIIEGFCLLRDETVRAIAVDGANRKWIGTQNGAYLVNSDGTELIQFFNEENSPLISNVINDIAIEPNTGEVFFATNQGIVSYMGDATTPKENTNEVLVFPNPVKPEFDGQVTIRNLVNNSIVKITTMDGRLVKELRSLGGQAVWDRKDLLGNKVVPGVYLILISDEKGKNTAIQKIAIL